MYGWQEKEYRVGNIIYIFGYISSKPLMLCKMYSPLKSVLEKRNAWNSLEQMTNILSDRFNYILF